jgi:lipopolysaccharide/colanic/teichoic acid biosynthesis glycosyltransferase
MTCPGRILRRWKLDELPQLINVLRGEMRFVGPRPEDPRYVATESDKQQALLTITPGITSLASLTYRNEADLLTGGDWEHRYRSEILPHKVALDLEYEKSRSIWTDLGLIFRTLGEILK